MRSVQRLSSEEKMAELQKSCPKCDERMEQGFVADKIGELWGDVSMWNPGPPESSFFTLTKRSPKALPMAAFRCSQCGLVEFYADNQFART
jgi:predicted nucleic-acid-binding Zn-ribbon protein